MKYGMNLLLWTGEMNDSMLPVLKLVKTLGYDGVELPIFNTALDYRKWGKILDDFGLERTAVTIRGVDDNPISPDANIRKKGIEGTMRCLDCCARDVVIPSGELHRLRETDPLGKLIEDEPHCVLQRVVVRSSRAPFGASVPDS